MQPTACFYHFCFRSVVNFSSFYYYYHSPTHKHTAAKTTGSRVKSRWKYSKQFRVLKLIVYDADGCNLLRLIPIHSENNFSRDGNQLASFLFQDPRTSWVPSYYILISPRKRLKHFLFNIRGVLHTNSHIFKL